MIKNDYGDYTLNYKEFRVFVPSEIIDCFRTGIGWAVKPFINELEDKLKVKLDDSHGLFVDEDLNPVCNVPFVAYEISWFENYPGRMYDEYEYHVFLPEFRRKGCCNHIFVSFERSYDSFDLHVGITFTTKYYNKEKLKEISDKELTSKKVMQKWELKLFSNILRQRIQQRGSERVTALKERLIEWIINA